MRRIFAAATLLVSACNHSDAGSDASVLDAGHGDSALADMAMSDSSMLDATSSDAGEPCGENYLRMRVQTSDTTRTYCAPAAEATFYFTDVSTCSPSSGAVHADDEGVVGMDVQKAGSWFAHNESFSRVQLILSTPASETNPACQAHPQGCTYRSVDCEVEVIRSGNREGDLVEGRLAAPCLLDGDDGANVVAPPNVLAMDFRAMLQYGWYRDGGPPCDYPPDAGMP